MKNHTQRKVKIGLSVCKPGVTQTAQDDLEVDIIPAVGLLSQPAAQWFACWINDGNIEIELITFYNFQ